MQKVLLYDTFCTLTVDLRSGAGELVGITGTATIDSAEDGIHTFTLDYALPE